ncbi:unnamed protein product [Protopolystoma xenopodis]|uniref:Uncharacterized protein n=1 Tax=Protopolystoma xenopodis TaxID=117903 RepID=A0A3S5AHD8_9PLAT|nr:unnamed protein product [Protopolystoma xenopodis]
MARITLQSTAPGMDKLAEKHCKSRSSVATTVVQPQPGRAERKFRQVSTTIHNWRLEQVLAGNARTLVVTTHRTDCNLLDLCPRCRKVQTPVGIGLRFPRFTSFHECSNGLLSKAIPNWNESDGAMWKTSL